MATSGSRYAVRRRAFAIWQKLGYLPWRKEKKNRGGKTSGAFYKGAFNDIPFLNDDAKRTFQQLLLRPGHMIRDYISGQHERYLAPLTALIIFYAFFALISSVLQPIQQDPRKLFDEKATVAIQEATEGEEEHAEEQRILFQTIQIVQKGYTYLHLDQFPDDVHTKREAALAAFEGRLRSQGIPLFLGEFFLLWFAMAIALRRYKLGMSAYAACSAYVLCQFCFFMLFALLLTWGKKASVGIILMGIVLTVDYHQLLGINWKKSIGRAVATGFHYFLLYATVLILISIAAVLLAYFRG
ncbi:MAG: DUF3667 domain-containing protein [Bacteroidales bacterium]|nr:DUF3667 domain-containing protein [Bacteroidales bacterium]